MTDQYLSGKFPTLERLALLEVRKQFPLLRRKGFSAAVRAAVSADWHEDFFIWSRNSKRIPILPDGCFEKPTGAFTCIEIERVGDNCGVCGAHLMHNERTHYGVRDGVLTLTSDCCVSQLDRLVGSGLYTCRTYHFISSSENAPQLTLAEIELATGGSAQRALRGTVFLVVPLCIGTRSIV
jgi:hypothetical protein